MFGYYCVGVRVWRLMARDQGFTFYVADFVQVWGVEIRVGGLRALEGFMGGFSVRIYVGELYL